jgi:hypothetical protein
MMTALVEGSRITITPFNISITNDHTSTDYFEPFYTNATVLKKMQPFSNFQNLEKFQCRHDDDLRMVAFRIPDGDFDAEITQTTCRRGQISHPVWDMGHDLVQRYFQNPFPEF